ncbi:unnamed protein product, partial [Ectocarpus sp. 13 AM-2016]
MSSDLTLDWNLRPCREVTIPSSVTRSSYNRSLLLSPNHDGPDFRRTVLPSTDTSCS